MMTNSFPIALLKLSIFFSILSIFTILCYLPSAYPTTELPLPLENYTDIPLLPPEFPWPPPTPSAIATLSLGMLGDAVSEGFYVTFKDVDHRISEALSEGGYFEKSYFLVPNGFAIVTRLEQIDELGYPDPNRWISEVEPISITGFSLSKYLEALFGVPEGHYRVFVFLVSSDLIVQSGTPTTQEEMERMYLEGANQLPVWMETLPYTPEHICTVYVYEFVQSGIEGSANQNIPSRITGQQHLVGAGLWYFLEEKIYEYPNN